MMKLSNLFKAKPGSSTDVQEQSHLPRGVDMFYDLRSALPRWNPLVVFDVGANIGQSAQGFLKGFPHARIYSFEPASIHYARLQAALQNESRAQCLQLAFGKMPGQGKMVHTGHPHTFFKLDTANQVVPNTPESVENAEITTIDAFCRANDIPHIHFLKVDTEGGDLDVLVGAEHMLREQRIDLVQVEAGMNPANERHIPFDKFRELLEPRGYYLFALYEQVSEWPMRAPHLRRTNPVFISQTVIEQNRLPAP